MDLILGDAGKTKRFGKKEFQNSKKTSCRLGQRVLAITTELGTVLGT
jgi:hypothetical protein